MGHNWLKSNTIIDIIDKLPEFIAKTEENEQNKILVYYGDYTIDQIYNMNDFMLNAELVFTKVKQRFKKKETKNKFVLKDRYIVLTDIYFLLFDPVPDRKNFAKLLFWGDIRQILSNRVLNFSDEILLIDWRNDNKVNFLN